MKTFKEYLQEAVEATTRQNMIHLQKMDDVAFIDFAHKLKRETGGKLQDIKVSLKVDGAGCLKHDTKIETLEYGTLNISDIVENEIACHVKSFNGEEITFEQVTGYRVLEESDDWYEIELEDGSTLTLTGNHPVFLTELKCFRRTDELIVGDEVFKD